MIRRMLIANRGEIALRVARACRELGIEVVAPYSTADAGSAVVRLADAAVCIGPPRPADSYLNIPNLIGAALHTGADAVHPGYGFLSEDPDFAEICADAGLVFVGPRPSVMEQLGNKAVARALMSRAGLPLLAGTTEPVDTVEQARAVADAVGYPVIVKAAAGGGGRGMSVVESPRDLAPRYLTTRSTAQAVFGDSSVYIERYLPDARHVEIQILCDEHGGGIHLGERDCSVQRRHQKLIEEAPSSRLSSPLRAAMGEAAVRAARAVGYTGAGTFEFLLDADNRFYFMEVNARIQVEHPVTEMTTGIDLVQEQIRIASGLPLAVTQDAVTISGAAIECRINAEDPTRDFAPTPGLVETYRPPGGPWTRVDADCCAGHRVSPYYDSLLAKVVVWAPDREQALARMRRALAEFEISGPALSTTVDLHRAILAHPQFRAGLHSTAFIDHLLTARPPAATGAVRPSAA
nr:pyruvate carboxylase subunit A [uncultured bacterium]